MAISSIWAELQATMKHWVKDIFISLDHSTQGTQVKIETRKSLVDTTWLGLKAKIAEVTGDFFKGLRTARHEFRTQLEQVEARAEHRYCHRMGSRAGVVQTTKFDGSTSWAVFRQQFETVTEHSS
jgi:hypothetical protein